MRSLRDYYTVIIANYSENLMCQMRYVLVIIRMEQAEKADIRELREVLSVCRVDNL